MNGYRNKRVTLTANTPIVVDFEKKIFDLSIARMTSAGDVYFKVGEHDTMATTDLDTNVLNNETPVFDFEGINVGFSKITFVSNATVSVQWNTKE